MCEWVFLIIFTCEMMTKIFAYGFICHREAYLHDPWCQLDFTVVTLAWLPILFPDMGNYSVLRAFRALRPLRALKRVPGMPMLVQWILTVLPKMGNVLMLQGFIFLVFGIVGMELFMGQLHYRCALPGFEETPGHPVTDVRRLEETPGEPLGWSRGTSWTASAAADVVPSAPTIGQPHAPGLASALLAPLVARAADAGGWAARRFLKGAHEEGAAAHGQELYDTGITCNSAKGHTGCSAYAPPHASRAPHARAALSLGRLALDGKSILAERLRTGCRWAWQGLARHHVQVL